MAIFKCSLVVARRYWFLVALVVIKSIQEASGEENSRKWASSLNRIGKLMTTPIKTSQATRASCLRSCSAINNCQSFNHQASTLTCELLDTYLCADESDLSKDDLTWRYFDLLDYKNQEEEGVFYNHTMCTERGQCSLKCGRQLGEVCREDLQCTAVVRGGVECKAADNNATTGICNCTLDHWQYNSTICTHTYSQGGSTWNWIDMRIVNDMCSVTFTVHADRVYLLLNTKTDFESGVYYYRIELGIHSDTWSRIRRVDAEVKRYTGALLTDNFNNITLSWCSSTIKVAREGQAPILQWTDPNPLTIKGLSYYFPDSGTKAHIFFPHNVVDPYYPNNVAERTIRTNSHHWHMVKIFPDRSTTTSEITFNFQCKSAYDMRIIFGRFNDNSRQYQVILDAHQSHIWIYNGRLGDWIVKAPNADLVSPTEFHEFWIKINGTDIRIGTAGDDTPKASHTDPSTSVPTFSHIGLRTCCKTGYGYWKILSHPQFHDYPNGAYYT